MDTTAAESERHESNIWDDCSEKINRGEEPPAVSHHGGGAEHPDTAAGGVAVHLPLLDVMPAYIVQASQGRIIPIVIGPDIILRKSNCYQVLPSERWTQAVSTETVPPAPPIPSDPHSQVTVHGPQSDDDLQ